MARAKLQPNLGLVRMAQPRVFDLARNLICNRLVKLGFNAVAALLTNRLCSVKQACEGVHVVRIRPRKLCQGEITPRRPACRLDRHGQAWHANVPLAHVRDGSPGAIVGVAERNAGALGPQTAP